MSDEDRRLLESDTVYTGRYLPAPSIIIYFPTLKKEAADSIFCDLSYDAVKSLDYTAPNGMNRRDLEGSICGLKQVLTRTSSEGRRTHSPGGD
jgi:hypothetical protein